MSVNLKPGSTVKTVGGEKVTILKIFSPTNEPTKDQPILGILHDESGQEVHTWARDGRYNPSFSPGSLDLELDEFVPPFEVVIGGLLIALTQQGKDKFTVTYWKQVRSNLDYAAAARELGECIFHALACEGQIDNGGG